MNTYPNISAFDIDAPTVVTIGTFDGVHIGHRAIVKRLTGAAQQEGLQSVILTFFPHPRMVLQKDNGIQLLNTIDERTDILSKTGLQHLIIHPFTERFSRLTALEFVRDVLANQLRAKKVIIGYDHRFGRNRTANIDDLREYGKDYGFSVEEISARECDDVAVSSTKIRNALQQGDIATANAYLGYAYTLQGTVVRGRGIGRELHYPTANLQLAEDYKLIPKNGVYVVQATLDGRRVFGLTSIGTNPTVGGTQRTIETHFLDFQYDLYDRPVAIEILIRIRDEEKFASVQDLQAAIQKDEAFARRFLEEL